MKKQVVLGITLMVMVLAWGRISHAQNSHRDLYQIWNLAALYKLEDIAESGYSFDDDPKMHEIWSLRGEDLRYFLDFIEGINIARSEAFGPAVNEDIEMTLVRE